MAPRRSKRDEQLVDEGRAEDDEERHERQHVARKIGKRLERRGLVDEVPQKREARDQEKRHPPLARRDERRRKADEAEGKERRPETRPQAFAEVEQAPGEAERQRHVMALHRMHELGIHAPLPAVEPSDRRQHDEEKGADRDAGDGSGSRPPPLGSGRRDEQNGDDGEGQDQHADIFRAGGKSGEETEQDRATRRRLLQQPDQRSERQHEEGRDENILLEEAGMHGDERRHRGGRRGRQGWQVGQHEPCQAEGGEHEDAAGQSAEHPGKMRQGRRSGGCARRAAACATSIMKSGW